MKNRIKTGSRVLTAILLLSIIITSVFAINSISAATVTSTSIKEDFYDLKGHWSENALKPLIEKGILNGIKENGVIKAMPDKSITRAQFVTILVRAFGLKRIDGNVKKFKDTNSKAWYFNSFEVAVSNSLIAGYPDGTFRPDALITNEQVQIIITRLENTRIKDEGGVVGKEWYNKNIIVGLKSILGSIPKTAFILKSNATRAEAMSVVYKYFQIIEALKPKITPTPSTTEASVTASPAVGPTPTPTPASGAGNDPGSLTPATSTPAPTATTQPTLPPATNPGVLGYKLTAKVGDMVYYQVYAYALTDIGKFNFKITYDPAIVVATSVRNGAIKATNYVGQDLSQAGSGTVIVKSEDTSPVVQSDGTLFTIVFRVQPGAAGATDIKMTGINGSLPELYTTSGAAITQVTSSDGSITVQ